MQQDILTVGVYEVNCVVLWADPAQAWVVDPGADAGRIRALLNSHHLRIAQVVCTHGHIDHVSGLDGLLATNPAPVWMHDDDAQWAFSAINRLPPAYPEAPRRPDSLRTNLTDGGRLAGGGIEVQTIFVPGHTPGGICLYLEQQKLLLTGDTLFAGAIGRTDLPGSDARRLKQSLVKLMALPDDTRVIPGHGPITTIGDERRTNPYLQGF